MLAVYFDESGTHADSKVCSVSGLLSPLAQWTRLERAWQRILDEEEISAFHMTDCECGHGEFATWEPERRTKLIIRLLELVRRRVHWRTWTVVLLEEYRHQFSGDENEELPYTFCTLACASQLRRQLETMNSKHDIHYTFAGGGKGGRFAVNALRRVLDTGQGEYYRVASVTESYPSKCLPLQAADIHTREVYKYFANQADDSGRPMRKPLKVLATIPEAGTGGNIIKGSDVGRFLELHHTTAREQSYLWTLEPFNLHRDYPVVMQRIRPK